MKKIFIIALSYIILVINSNLLAQEKDKLLKVGLLAPLTGEYEELGKSLLYSLQLALEEIGDEKIYIVPRDAGFNNKVKLNKAIRDLNSEGIKIFIGPISNNDFKEVKKFSNSVFISPSNISPDFDGNVVSVGVSLESQLISLNNFLKKQKKKKTVIMLPKNNYTDLIEKKIEDLELNFFKIFKYNPDPQVLTGEIEVLTNYSQRKRNLELKKKLFEDKEDSQSVRQLEKLEQLYTLGEVNFDSLIIIDFGNNLKSVLTSLVYADVDPDKVLFTTVNQWFDKSIFYENTIKKLYYPSINFKQFTKYNEKYFKKFKSYPNEITILTYDALGLIYYVWKKNEDINSLNDFSFKNKIKGKIGTFSFKDKKVIQDLDIYKVENNKFTKY
tara:strand:- start:262 stop:1416 length:1155 start_codon:yes stop_codon:yes gene_type:complete